MKHLAPTLTALALAGLLAGCSKKDQTAETTAPPVGPAPSAVAAAPAADMNRMPMAADAKMAKGTGTVTAVTAGSVTIDHGPIAEANWPAMTMTFKAAPDVAKSVKPGEKVAFDLKLQGGGGEVTAIRKQ